MQCQITGQTWRERERERESNPKQNKRLWAQRPELLPFQVCGFERTMTWRLIKKHKHFGSLFPGLSALFRKLHKGKAAWRLWTHPADTSGTSLSPLLLVNRPRCERRLIKRGGMVGCTQTVRRAAKWLFSPRPSRFLSYCCHCARYYYINNGNRVRLQQLRWAAGQSQTFLLWQNLVGLNQRVTCLYFLSLSLFLSGLSLKVIFDELWWPFPTLNLLM